MVKIKELFVKYKEIILYVFFGGLTTVVNWGGYLVLVRLMGGSESNVAVTAATALAEFLSILFAYVTNKKWVFESSAHGFSENFMEMLKFFGARAFSAVLDIVLMYVFVTKLHFNDTVMKLVANVIIIVVNYVASKLFVFKKN